MAKLNRLRLWWWNRRCLWVFHRYSDDGASEVLYCARHEHYKTRKV